MLSFFTRGHNVVELWLQQAKMSRESREVVEQCQKQMDQAVSAQWSLDSIPVPQRPASLHEADRRTGETADEAHSQGILKNSGSSELTVKSEALGAHTKSGTVETPSEISVTQKKSGTGTQKKSDCPGTQGDYQSPDVQKTPDTRSKQRKSVSPEKQCKSSDVIQKKTVGKQKKSAKQNATMTLEKDFKPEEAQVSQPRNRDESVIKDADITEPPPKSSKSNGEPDQVKGQSEKRSQKQPKAKSSKHDILPEPVKSGMTLSKVADRDDPLDSREKEEVMDFPAPEFAARKKKQKSPPLSGFSTEETDKSVSDRTVLKVSETKGLLLDKVNTEQEDVDKATEFSNAVEEHPQSVSESLPEKQTEVDNHQVPYLGPPQQSKVSQGAPFRGWERLDKKEPIRKSQSPVECDRKAASSLGRSASPVETHGNSSTMEPPGTCTHPGSGQSLMDQLVEDHFISDNVDMGACRQERPIEGEGQEKGGVEVLVDMDTSLAVGVETVEPTSSSQSSQKRKKKQKKRK